MIVRDKTPDRVCNDALLTAFLELFLSCRDLGCYYVKVPTGWRCVRRAWTRRIVFDHLTGQAVIGIPPGVGYDLLIFDIDNKGDQSESVDSRVRRVMRLFDAEPLICTSSESGGMRVCYFLERVYFRDDIYDFARQRLLNANVQVKSGYIEIMATRKNDRLPFGKGSFVVDPATLDPLYELSLKGMIRHAQSIKNRSQLSIVGISRHRELRNLGKGDFGVTVEFLEDYGLPFGISTNEALLLLNRKQQGVLRRTPAEAARWLKSWIRKHHNGRSNRISNGEWQDVDDQIDRIVSSFDPSKYSRQNLTSITLSLRLTIRDIETLLAAGFDSKLLRAAFSLLEWVKNRGTLVLSIDRDDSEDSTGYVRDCLIRNNYLAQLSQVWLCQIPKGAMRQFSGFKKSNPAETLKRLIDRGLIELEREYNHAQHRCRTYLVFFTFVQESQEVVSLDEALELLKGSADQSLSATATMTVDAPKKRRRNGPD